jgi:hypothetical protein
MDVKRINPVFIRAPALPSVLTRCLRGPFMTEALLVTAGGCGLCLSSSTDGKAGARMKTGIIRSYVRLPFISQDGNELVLVGTCAKNIASRDSSTEANIEVPSAKVIARGINYHAVVSSSKPR